MQSLLLLHGAIGAAQQLALLAKNLERQYDVHTLNFSGHGGNTADVPFAVSTFTDDVLRYMDEHGLQKVSIMGYSMGGYVAMYLAKHHPERVDKIITLATKYHWDPPVAAKEVKMLDAATISAKIPAFAQTLQERHAPLAWEDILHKTTVMLTNMGEENPLATTDLASITHPVLLLIGDRDKMVSIDETLTAYRALPNAQMGMLPATPHPIEQVNVAVLGGYINSFLNN